MANLLGDHTISWHDGESDGYTDILPFEWFKDEGSRLRVRHDVEGPRSGRCGTAKCNVNVPNKVAILDYRPFKKENENQGMLLGVLRLDFASLSRKTIRKVQWKDSGQRSFSDRLITIHGRPRDDVSLMNYKFESSVTAALQLSSKELSRRLDKAPILPRKTMVATQQYNRSVYVAAKVHERAKEDAKIVEALLLFGAQTVGLTLKCITSYSWQKVARTRLKTQLLCVRIATVRLISANNEGETDPSPT